MIVAVFALLAFAVAGCGRGGSGSVASSKCGGLAHLAESAQKFSRFLTESNPDPEEFIEEFHDFAVFRYLGAVGGAPDEIRGDLRVLDDAFSKYVDAIASLDLGNLDRKGNLDSNALERLQQAIAGLDRADLDPKALEKLQQAIAGLDPGNLDQKALEKLQRPSIEINEHKVMQASRNISAWVQRMQKNCT